MLSASWESQVYSSLMLWDTHKRQLILPSTLDACFKYVYLMMVMLHSPTPPSICTGQCLLHQTYILLMIGPLLMITTTFELSAQNPHSMKGLPVRVFSQSEVSFSFIIIPFSLKHPWASGKMIENPPVTNCGFAYLLFTCVVGLIGFVLFSLATKKYKYKACMCGRVAVVSLYML